MGSSVAQRHCRLGAPLALMPAGRSACGNTGWALRLRQCRLACDIEESAIGGNRDGGKFCVLSTPAMAVASISASAPDVQCLAA
jgi:hypothetical protein